MQIKILEVRDEGTCIPMLCIDMNNPANPAQAEWMRRRGFPLDGRPNIAMTPLDCDYKSRGNITNDPLEWGDRTRAIAHDHIIHQWGALRDGDVVDVQFILGETKEKKVSELKTDP